MFWLLYSIPLESIMKLMFCTIIFGACLSATGCAKGGCVERISHGPWKAIGQKPPSKLIVEGKFKEQGLPALLLTFGEPSARSEQQVVWIFEARSVSHRQRCSPDRKEDIYDQSFTIVSVKLGAEAQECRYEVRELLSKEIYLVKDFTLIPKSSLGIKETSCGVMKKGS